MPFLHASSNVQHTWTHWSDQLRSGLVSPSFRDTEADICGNGQVKRILDSLGLRVLQLRHVSLSQPERLEQSLNDRERQVRAYEARDATLAIALTRSMVLNAFAAIERSGWTGFQMEKDDEVA
jgi:DNA-binding GntR family transcriptional regulator